MLLQTQQKYFKIAEKITPAFEIDLKRLITSKFQRLYTFDICVRYKLTENLLQKNRDIYIQLQDNSKLQYC